MIRLKRATVLQTHTLHAQSTGCLVNSLKTNITLLGNGQQVEERGTDSGGHGTGQSLQVRRQRKISSGSKRDSERYPIGDL